MPRASKRASDTRAPGVATNAPSEAEYLEAVAKGKAIIDHINGKQWALGDLADTVEKVYGENRLKQFAEDINFPGAVCTLERCRDVCRAFPKNRVRTRFFVSAQVLAAHPDRFAIVERNPDISKREAREIMRLWKEENPSTQADQTEEDDLLEEPATEPTPGAISTPAKEAKAKGPKKTDNEEQATLKENRRWFNTVVDLANAAIAEAGVMENTTPEEGRRLAKAIQPRLVKEIEKGGEALVALADWLKKLLAETSDELIEEGRVNTSPKRASAPSQVTV